MAKETSEAAKRPGKIRLTHLHGFIDENDRNRVWRAGDVVTDPAEIALLVDRKAPIETLE
jgi:hypothetical protein